MRHLLFASAFVACASLACSTSYTVTDDLGDPCVDDTDCRDVCLTDTTSGTCSVRCDPEDPRACVPGWACGRTPGSDEVACRCDDPGTERCNGLDDDCDGAMDERLDCVVRDSFTVDVTPPSSVDLLFVIDNTMTMSSEHKAMLRELPRVIRAVTSGDFDEDGRAERAPNEFLHVGVVSTDMGVGDAVVPTCNRPFGDDGVLRFRGDLSLEGCEMRYPSPTFFAFEPGTDLDAFAATASCVVSTGTNGCGFEQPLEAALKAVTRETSSLRFAEGSVGHADGANAGFLRAGSLLWIVILTEEDDCSVRDPSIFSLEEPAYTGDLNLRCLQYDEALHPIERFVDGLLATRADPSLLHVSLLAGLPPETDTPAGGSIDYDAILDHPLMQAEVDPEMPSRARPSCNRFDGWREWQVSMRCTNRC